MINAASSAGRARCHGDSPGSSAARGPEPEGDESASMSNARSCADWKRSAGFFSRQW